MHTFGTPRTRRLWRRLRSWGLICLAGAAAWLPLPVLRRMGQALAGAAYPWASSLRQEMNANLTRAFPQLGELERQALARASFRHLGLCLGEWLGMASLLRHRQRWIRWAPGARPLLDRCLARGRGVVFVSGHLGNWELLAAAVAVEGYPCHTVAKETSDPALTRWIERVRARSGLHVIWRGQAGAAKSLLRTLKQGAILGMLIDQDTRVQSVFVPFFGHPAKTPRAAADLALRHGAAVLLGSCHRQPDGTFLLRLEEIPLPEATPGATELLTGRLNAALESAIRENPEQWVWFHRRWKSKPPDTTGGAP